MAKDKDDLTGWYRSQLSDLKSEFDKLQEGLRGSGSPPQARTTDSPASSPTQTTRSSPNIAPTPVIKPPQIKPVQVKPLAAPSQRRQETPPPERPERYVEPPAVEARTAEPRPVEARRTPAPHRRRPPKYHAAPRRRAGVTVWASMSAAPLPTSC